jgi:hypothetical protein
MTAWLFALLLRRRDREMILGDLAEERALLAGTLSPSALARWHRSQMLRSVPPILWAHIRRGLWLKTLGATLAAYFLVAGLIAVGDIVLTAARVRPALYPFASLAASFLVMTLGGYLAAAMRPRAPAALAVLSAALAMVSMTLPGPHAPFWYECGLVFLGPAAALAGGSIFRRKQRSRNGTIDRAAGEN